MSSWDDIIFKNRNKSYGAYDLRKKYIIGMLIAVGVVLQLMMLFAIVSLFQKDEIETNDNGVRVVTSYLPRPPLEIEPKDDVLPELKRIKKADAFTAPKVIETDIEIPPDNNDTENGNQVDNNGITDNGSESGVLDGEGSDDNDAIYIVVEEYPKFPGGEKALSQFLQRNIKYPKLAQDHKIQGRVYVSFVVEKDGSISMVKVVQGLGVGCDEEAVRVINMMPHWSPGRRKGTSVRVNVTLPLRFVLPVKK
jgi:protein TonB